jgi:hypothetical protein
MVAVEAQALEKECVGPRAPSLALIQVALGAANRPVDERDAARQANASGPGVEFQELAIRQAGHDYRLILSCGRLHGNSVRRNSKARRHSLPMNLSFYCGLNCATMPAKVRHLLR